jgi:tetratricopeptide (TPR) repeat protein
VNTEQLLTLDTGMRVSARHAVIARTVTRHAFPTARSRQAGLLEVLGKLNPSCSDEEELFREFFTQRSVYRTIVVLLDRDMGAVRQFYDAVRAIVTHTWPADYRKYVATCEALSVRMLGDDLRAKQCLIDATSIDPNYEFAVRQHAWLEHFEGHWDEAARLAIRAASLAPDNFETVHQCGRILSLGNVRSFRLAKPYLAKAQVLVPTSKMCAKDWESYCEGEILMSYVASLKEDDIVPDYVLKHLRPGVRFFRTLFGVSDSRFRNKLRGKLKAMEEEVRGDIGDLYEVLSGVDPKNATDKALVSCNVGRLLYLEWYHRGEPHDPEHIENAFRNSLELNPTDPFAHCWYGTFLKEVRRDFAGARREYDTALRIGKSSGNDRHKNHPLFLNNIGLLTLDQVQAGRLPPTALATARASFITAVQRTAELDTDFDWPQQSLERCDALMHEYGLL